MIKTENVLICPNFDSGKYSGTFTIVDAKENQYNFKYPSKLTKDDFDTLSLLIGVVVNKYIEGKNNGGN